MTPTAASVIQPFQFPTTTLFVDDHQEYLEVVPLLLDPELFIRTFNSPREALNLLKQVGSVAQPGGGWMYRWKDRPSARQELIALDVDSIHRIVYDPGRFNEVSVIVVDHFMPEMDGVEFCRTINNPFIGKILLTGRADDAVAIEAFNRGDIDRFIRKNDPQAISKLESAIRELRERYFHRVGGFVAETLALGNFGFLRDPSFRPVYDEVISGFQPVESYAYSHPTGLLMLDAAGSGRFLMVQTEKELMQQSEAAEDQGAPEDVVSALRHGEALPWFTTSDGLYHSELRHPGLFLYPAREIHGEHWYFYSLVDKVEPFRLDHVKSYRNWLHEQDSEQDAHASTD